MSQTDHQTNLRNLRDSAQKELIGKIQGLVQEWVFDDPVSGEIDTTSYRVVSEIYRLLSATY